MNNPTRASGGTSIIVNNTLLQSQKKLKHKPTGNSSISNFTKNNQHMLTIHTH